MFPEAQSRFRESAGNGAAAAAYFAAGYPSEQDSGPGMDPAELQTEKGKNK